MSPKGQNIFVSFNTFLFLRIIINGQHYIIIIIKSLYNSWLVKAQGWILLESSSKSLESIVENLCWF